MSLREKIGWQLLKWRTRESEHGHIQLPGLIAGAGRVAILLPANFDDFDVVRRFLPDLLDRMAEIPVTIWVRDNFRSWLVINESCTVMSYDPADSTRFGLPDGGTLCSVKAAEHDLLLDLSLAPDLYVTALAAAFRAKTKVALAHPETQRLYNLLVESNSADNAGRLSALLKYL